LPNAIGGGLEHKRHRDYLISVARMFYQMKDVRIILKEISGPVDIVFQLGNLFVCLERRQSSCLYSLRDIQAAPGMAPSRRALEAIQSLLQRLVRSQNSTVTRVIHQALFFKGIVVEAENPPVS
jgi:hypothetical protein